MKKRYSFILACLVSTIAVADNYTTGGDGTTYSLEKLASVQGSGVSKDGSVYTLATVSPLPTATSSCSTAALR